MVTSAPPRIADHCAPQREVFHPPDVVGDLDRVANHVLVFEHDVEPRDHVSNQCLRPEGLLPGWRARQELRRRSVMSILNSCSAVSRATAQTTLFPAP